MAQKSFLDKLHGLIRKFHSVYALLRSAKRFGTVLLVECFRKLGRRTIRIGAAVGFFSGDELVGKGAPGRIILPSQTLKPAAPDCLRSSMKQNGWQPWPVFWIRHRNARLVSPTLALLDENKRLLLESVWGSQCAVGDPANTYLFLPKAVQLDGCWTSIVARWNFKTGYYHWLTDSLPRLALLKEFPRDTSVIVPANLCSFQIETLKLLGLEGRYRCTHEKHLLVENYYFSSATAMSGCDNPYAVRFLRENFLKHADASGPTCRKLFIRRKGKTRGISNETEVADFFANKGWTILDMENIPFVRQIQLFANVEMVCGLHGAAFTNLLWCRPGTKVLELCASNFLNGCYEGIASYVDANHRFMIFPGESSFSIFVDLKSLDRVLKEMED